MGDAGPPQEIASWVQSVGWGKTLPTALSQAHDLYAFGTQVRIVRCDAFFTLRFD